MPEQSSASDDIFVEYFNEFLQLGIFVPKVEYNRQLNTFIEKKHQSTLINPDEQLIVLDHQPKEQESDDVRSIYSGFSEFIQLDEVPERDGQNTSRLQKQRQGQVMDWAKTERLALFWRTELYRQYKLCKLLLRPITGDREGSEISSQGIGGYSRQSVYTAARTLSTENSNLQGPHQTGTLDEDDDQQQQASTEIDPSDPWSNMNYIFDNNFMTAEFLRMPRAFLRPGSRAYSVPANMTTSLSIFFSSDRSKKSPAKKSKRSSSSNASHRKSLPKDDDQVSTGDPNDPRSTSMFSSAKIRYMDDGDIEEENENLDDLGLEMHGSSNQLKYKYLGSFRGMQTFVRFLQSTTGGYDLYRFWMDCEFFKDTMAGLDQIENVVARTRLFRDLNDDKHHLPFMRHLQNKIRRAYTDSAGALTHDVFLQVQYDVLRRLRMYWSARFIIHQLFQRHHPHLTKNSSAPDRLSPVCLYPIDQRAQPTLTEMNRVFLSDDYTTNAQLISDKKTLEIQDAVEQSFDNPIMRKYVTVIRQDKQAGGLFLRYITFNERKLLPLMLFCYDVDDFRYSNLDDKVLESQHGLSILNTYFGNSAKLSLDQFMPDIQIGRWIETFHRYQFDKLSFEPLFKRVLLILKDAWLRCLKEDVDRYTSAYYLSPVDEEDDEAVEDKENLSIASEDDDDIEEKLETALALRRPVRRVHSPETQINISNNMIYIKRPWLLRFISSAASDRKERFLEALENAMTDEERQRLRAERKERLKRIEEGRKKAMKAARERQKRMTKGGEGTDGSASDKTAGRRSDLPLYIDRILPHKTGPILSKDAQKLITTDLSRYNRSSKTPVPNLEQRLNLLLDIGKWMESTSNFERQSQIDRMKKVYFDPQSKRGMIPLNPEHAAMLDANNGRPDAAFLNAVYRDFRLELEGDFLRYCDDRIHRFEIETVEEYLSKSSDELTLLFNDLEGDTKTSRDDEEDFGGMFDPDIAAIAANKDGTGKATRKHTAELFQLISDAALGRFNERFYYFYSYLTHWVGEKDTAYLDQDLLFCIDVSRLKEIANDSMLQAKLRYILETYLEGSQTSNNYVCRLDIGSTDLQLRVLRTLQKAVASNANDFSVLEEARTILVKDKLVKYYAGFKAYLFRMNLSKTHPSRLARLQEQWTAYQQQLRSQKSAKSHTRSSASTSKHQQRKVPSAMSKHQSAPATPIDLTSMTKTQRSLNERMSFFNKLPENQISEAMFPTINRPNRPRSGHHQRARGFDNERLSSPKDTKHRGPITVQYSLTTGLKLRLADGKSTIEGPPPTTSLMPNGLHQPRGSMAPSMSSVYD